MTTEKRNYGPSMFLKEEIVDRLHSQVLQRVRQAHSVPHHTAPLTQYLIEKEELERERRREGGREKEAEVEEREAVAQHSTGSSGHSIETSPLKIPLPSKRDSPSQLRSRNGATTPDILSPELLSEKYRELELEMKRIKEEIASPSAKLKRDVEQPQGVEVVSAGKAEDFSVLRETSGSFLDATIERMNLSAKADEATTLY